MSTAIRFIPKCYGLSRIWTPRYAPAEEDEETLTWLGSKYSSRPQLSQFNSVPSRTWFQNCGRNDIWQERQRCPSARASAVLREEEAMRSYWASKGSFTPLRILARSFCRTANSASYP